MTATEFISRYQRKWLYHFTDIHNLPSIRKLGLLAFSELCARRVEIPKPGGNQWSHDADRANGVDSYVHLCLLSSGHPMEYVARSEGRIGTTRYLKISTEVLFQDGVLGSWGLANRQDALILPLEAALDVMSLYLLFGGYGDLSDTEYRDDYLEAKKSEIMIPRHIPTHMIFNLE